MLTALRHASRRTAAKQSSSAVGKLYGIRFCSTASPEEQQIAQRLRDQLPGAAVVNVTDTSGGCGSMFKLEVTADEFRDIGVVKQHQLVAKLLDKEIKTWHGFTLDTRPTPANS